MPPSGPRRFGRPAADAHQHSPIISMSEPNTPSQGQAGHIGVEGRVRRHAGLAALADPEKGGLCIYVLLTPYFPCGSTFLPSPAWVRGVLPLLV